MRYQFTSAQAGANDKCGRLGLEGHKKSLVSYQDYQILTVSHHAGVATKSVFPSLLFARKMLICLEGKSMTPIREVSIALFHSFQQLIRLGPLKGFFKLTLLHKPLNNLASNIGFQTSEIQGQFQGRRAMDSVWYNRKNLEFVLVEKPCP